MASTPKKHRRSRVANAVVKRDPALISAFIEEKLQAQKALLDARVEMDEYKTGVNLYGVPRTVLASSAVEAEALTEWYIDRSHEIPRS